MLNEKTPKQKCLEMWEWLAKNPGKDRYDYEQVLAIENRYQEFHSCWACYVAKRLCKDCPINWSGHNCCSPKSPFAVWDSEDAKKNYKFSEEYNVKRQQQAALAIVELIKTTWED